MSPKIKTQISHIFSKLSAVAARIPSQPQRLRVTSDVERLIALTKKTVDNDELALILKQAQAKMVMARIRYKSILDQLEREQTEEPVLKSEAEQFEESVKIKDEYLKRQLEESARNQQKIANAYRQIAKQIEKDSRGLLEDLQENKEELNKAWDAINESNKQAQERKREASKDLQGVYVNMDNLTVEGEESLQKTEQKLEKMQKNPQETKIEGIINLDPLSGNFSYERMEELESESYVIRKGKLVKGKAKKREEASFTNWHGGNADPEDLIRHRQMLDRQHYKGPVWENKRPQSILESNLSQVAEQEKEELPQTGTGEQTFEKVVR